MTNVEEMKTIMAWCDAHNFPVKQVNNILYWKTNYQTAEYDINTRTTIWHNAEYFNIIKVEN